MSIKKQKNGNYQVRVQFTDSLGRRRNKKKTVASLTLAKRAEREILNEVDAGTFNKVHKKITMNELIDKFMLDYSRGKRKVTIVRRKIFLENSVLTDEWFNNVQVSKISRQIIQAWLDWIASEHSSYKSESGFLKKILDFAVSYDFIDVNPFSNVRYPTPIDKPDRSYRVDSYEYDELLAFIDAVKSKYEENSLKYRKYVYLRLLAFTGMRMSEARALLWSDIEFTDAGANISVNKTLSRSIDSEVIINEPKTKAGKRTVIVDKITAQTLKQWHNIQQQAFMKAGVRSDVVFTNRRLNNYLTSNQPREWILAAIRGTDVPQINVHGLRHTYITLAVQAGMDIKTLQAQVGHNDINTTLNVYATVTKDMRAKTADIFTSLVNF
ncbi:site-specific integrase [Weissella muntiaci]|uniref:Site-specific integrase n=2 Tax=Weissella muntiaci TaxID=2508881 RepID=A0A6C2C689_9LACO|nr:site-specific integrase [Weissella muntiaci]